ncbi:DUF421 domain-containing protein [Microbispora sp. H10830]|uniref:DUF421 domain-containing protein n=1 Tax=Microbispora sp. H10830 TaxID=2729109 RepID=UPI0015FF561C|nr:YetF domain-containing protein [Microbispora sp. H10830]
MSPLSVVSPPPGVFLLFGQVADLGWVAVKTLLLYATAVAGLRLTKRRMIAELSPFDFVAAVAVGAIVGRTATASDTSYLTGAAALLTVIAVHAVVTQVRLRSPSPHWFDHKPRILVDAGEIQRGQLRRCGLTEPDLYVILRQHGVASLSSVRYVIFEPKGAVSVVTKDRPVGDVTRQGLRHPPRM